MTPLVSIIVPNYKHADYLLFRIESILNQSFQNFELIILDDCSPDNSRSIISNYSNHHKISHIVYNDVNSGSPFIQWTKGIELAIGKYIWIAESDDMADPNFLANTVNVLERNPSVSLVFTGSQMIDANGRHLVKDWDRFSKNCDSQTRYTSHSFLSQHMLKDNSVYNASAVLFRRANFFKIDNQKYKTFKYCGDWLFWIEMTRQGDVVKINKKLNYFRQHENKVSPNAVRLGLYYIEGGYIVEYLIKLLNLTFYDQRVLGGRFYKHLLRSSRENPELKTKVLDMHSSLFQHRKLSILMYEFDKIFKSSKHMKLELMNIILPKPVVPRFSPTMTTKRQLTSSEI